MTANIYKPARLAHYRRGTAPAALLCAGGLILLAQWVWQPESTLGADAVETVKAAPVPVKEPALPARGQIVRLKTTARASQTEAAASDPQPLTAPPEPPIV